jgi:hypothetical protein
VERRGEGNGGEKRRGGRGGRGEGRREGLEGWVPSNRFFHFNTGSGGGAEWRVCAGLQAVREPGCIVPWLCVRWWEARGWAESGQTMGRARTQHLRLVSSRE